jgi:hypothetical protein
MQSIMLSHCSLCFLQLPSCHYDLLASLATAMLMLMLMLMLDV